MSRRAGLALVLAAAVAAGLVVAAADSPQNGLLTAGILLASALPALVAAWLLAAQRARLGSLRHQLRLTMGLALAQLLVVSLAFAGLMFLSAHDALLLTVVAVFSGVVAVAATSPVSRSLLADVGAIREGLDAVGRGEREVRVTPQGRDELAALAGATNRMAERLAAQEDARRELLAAISHDLRTPITSLRLLTDALREEVIPPEERRLSLERMDRHLRILGTLIDDLFDLARLEAGDAAWTLQRVGLPMLVEEVVDAVRPEAGAKGVEVRSRVPEELTPVAADPERLQRVLFNLLQNAIRHTPADGSVTVLADPKPGQLEVEVADTGPGIPTGARERVFEPFVRGSEAGARTSAGAGLGLAIARAIVEAHGGRIWLEPAPGPGGTRVRFSLRYAEELGAVRRDGP